jgi:hypothetical protein
VLAGDDTFAAWSHNATSWQRCAPEIDIYSTSTDAICS